jgi:orotate phosphoribosyltransferase
MTTLESTSLNQIEALLKETQAWQSGHFLLSSGLHSDAYMQCQKIMQYPLYSMTLAHALMQKVLEQGFKPKAIVGPALGAVHLEVYCALAINEILGLKNADQVRAIFAEKLEDTSFAIRRGIELAPGEEVIVVEDVTTTGGSAKKVVELLEKMGAKPVAVAALIDRSQGKAQFERPFISLLQLSLPTYEPATCPLCKTGSQAIKPGSGKILK